MTATAIEGAQLVPHPISFASSSNAGTLDATTDYVAYVFRVPATGTIANIHFRTGTSSLSGTLNGRLETLDASGDPSGSAYGSSATGTQVNPSATTNYSFAVNATATVGDDICFKLWADPVTSGSVNIAYGPASVWACNQAFPYVTTRSTGTGAGTHTGNALLMLSVEYSGGVFYPIMAGCCGVANTTTIDNDASIRRAGNLFISAVPMTVIGLWAIGDVDGNTTTLKLYDTNGTTVLGTATITSAKRGITSGAIFEALFDSGTTVEISAATASGYRCVMETTSTAADVTIRTITNIPAQAHQDQLSMGSGWYFTSHNGTSWNGDDTTARAMCGLIVSKFDNGAGAGGLAANPAQGFVR